MRKEAASLGLRFTLVNITDALVDTLLAPEWRRTPMSFDIPASSQLYGRIVLDAGIGGIVYPSKFTKKDCLAIFPRNLRDSNSHVALDDLAPHPGVLTKLDSSNWQMSERTPDEVVG